MSILAQTRGAPPHADKLTRFLGHDDDFWRLVLRGNALTAVTLGIYRFWFTTEVRRTQRRSDGTLSLEGVRFEVPSRFGHLEELWLRYASWDLRTVYLADPKTGAILCRIYPVDKTKNAQGQRAPRAGAETSTPPPAPSGMAPLLQKIIQQYALTGLPPAYLPQPQNPQNPS